MNIKAITLKVLHENRLTRDICPGVRTEDWVLCCGFRRDVADYMARIRPEYITTPTGQAILAKLHSAAAQGTVPPALKALDRAYKAEAKAHPERAVQNELIRLHILKLERIQKRHRRRTSACQMRRILRVWCEERHLALHPNRQRPTAELERQFGQVQQELDSIQAELHAIYVRARNAATRSRDLFCELRLRPECKIEARELRDPLSMRDWFILRELGEEDPPLQR